MANDHGLPVSEAAAVDAAERAVGLHVVRPPDQASVDAAVASALEPHAFVRGTSGGFDGEYCRQCLQHYDEEIHRAFDRDEPEMEPWEVQWRRSLRLQRREYRPMKPHELDSMKDYVRCVEIREGKARRNGDSILEL